MGIVNAAHFRLFSFSSCGITHGPLTAIAALPATNWLTTSPWPQLMELLEIDPSFCRSTRNCSACAVSGVAMFCSEPPLPHMNGRNCHEPS